MKEFLKKNKNIVIGFGLFIFMFALDIVSKKLAHNLIDKHDIIPIIPYLFNFTHIHNTGAAFSLLENSEAAMIIFIVISLVASLVLGFGLVKYGNRSKVLSIGLGLIVAGALGNAIDRIFLGYVDDFIMFAFWESFAVFNVADVAVIFGTIFFAVYIIFIYKEPKKEEKPKELEKNESEKTI